MDSDDASMDSMDSDDERLMIAYGWSGAAPWLSDDGYDYEGYEDYGGDDDDSDNEDYTMLAPRTMTASLPPPPAPLAPPPPTLCRFFVLDKCRYGSRCTFSHALPANSREEEEDEDMMATVAATLVDCPFFQRGRCKYGQRCRLRHAPQANRGGVQNSSAPRPSADAAPQAAPCATATDNQEEFTCGVCLEDIVEAGKHFGLLNCDHCFCLECLRKWRQSKELEATRQCPACRVPSNFIVPSLKFCTGEEKLAVVDAYKRHLAIRECKYFDGTFGSCAFGADCFYAHRNGQGVDIKHLERGRERTNRRRQRSGSSAGGSSRGRRGGRGGRSRNNTATMLERYNDFFRLLDSLAPDDLEF